MYAIGIDPATKTFAYCFFYLDDEYFANYDDYMNKIKKLNELYQLYSTEIDSFTTTAQLSDLLGKINKITTLIKEWIAKLKPMIRIIGANTVDLVPGVPNKEISPTRRVKALGMCVEEIKSIVLKHCTLEELHVYVEYQMDINNKSNIVANAVLGMFYTSNLFTVDSRKKNTAFFGDKNKICNFSHNSSRGQNKAQSSANLVTVLEHFTVAATDAVMVTDHIADAFVQVMAYNLELAQGQTNN